MSKQKTPPMDHEERESHPIELSEEAAELMRAIEAERDDAVAARQRALADFANYQRRAAENERRALQSGAARLAQSIVPVLDHFDLALEQDTKQTTAEQLIGGVKIVRDELVKALQAHGVERIDPKPNDEFDPNKHEAMMRQDAPDVAPDHIVRVLQPGYAMGDHVLRPAKVAIASEPAPEQRSVGEGPEGLTESEESEE
jgi:molecular chaperone GrpE